MLHSAVHGKLPIMRSRLQNVFVAVLLSGAVAAAPAWAFRCGNRLVVEGDTQATVLARCGEPSEVRTRAVLRPAVFWRYGRALRAGPGVMEVEVDTWIYNLGPNRLMRRLRFEDGIVVEIETLGYGYHESSPTHNSRSP